MGAWAQAQVLVQGPGNAAAVVLLYAQALLAARTLPALPGVRRAPAAAAAAMHWLGVSGFFALGGSNSFATVDVTGAFVGLTPDNYRWAAGSMVAASTFAGPVLYALAAAAAAARAAARRAGEGGAGEVRGRQSVLAAGLVALALCSCQLAAFVGYLIHFRDHIFIWTVFAPKYVYLCTHTICAYCTLALTALLV